MHPLHTEEFAQMNAAQVDPIDVVPTHRTIMLTAELDHVPVGFALENVKSGPEGGETLSVRSRGFYTSDDGPELYTYLDNMFSHLLGKAMGAAGVSFEHINNCLVNITNGTVARIWINLPVALGCIPKSRLVNGQRVVLDDIADVREARFGIELPKCGSVAYTFQHGWRRGFYFNFNVFSGEGPDEPLEDLSKLFGSLHAALILRERIRMSEDVLERMSQAGWFPFIRLPHDLAMSLYRHFDIGWAWSDAESQIVRAMSANVQAWTDAWASKPVFEPHMDAIRNAVRLYLSREFMAASALLWPKVEGVLRHLHLGKGRATARSLRSNLLERFRAEVGGYTAYLPEAFVRYLETYYYASFDLESKLVPPSRHAFAHGVGPDGDAANPAFALRLLLTLDQLFFYV